MSQAALAAEYSLQREKNSLALNGGKGDVNYLRTRSGEIVQISGLSEDDVAKIQAEVDHPIGSPVLNMPLVAGENTIGVGVVINSRIAALDALKVTQKVGPIEIEVTKGRIRFTF
jgi:hypothetical protein